MQQLFNRLTAFGHRLVHRQRVEPSAYFRFGAVAHQITQIGIEPVARRPALFDHGDLHRLPVLERRVQRHHGTVHAGTPAAVAQVGMHAVGKVNDSSALRQFDNGRIRRQHVDAVVKHGSTGLHALLARQVTLPRQQLPQHGDFGVIFPTGGNPGITLDARFLVGPMRSHAMLGMVVHGLGADLNFDGLPSGLPCNIPDNGVQRLVAIGLGLGDVIVKLLGHGREMAVHPAQGGVTVGNAGDHNAQRTDVIHLLKPQ